MSLLHPPVNIKLIPVRLFDVEVSFALFELCSKFLETKMQDTATGWACLRSICGSCTLLSYWLWQDEVFSNSRSCRHRPSNFSTLLCIFFMFFFFYFFPGPFETPPTPTPPLLSSPSHLSGLELMSKHWDFVIVYMKTARIKPTKWNLKANVFRAASCP